jgi:hypothetical protein
MDKFEVLEYLNQHPEYARVLKLAVQHEEKNASEPHYLGWTWADVRAFAGNLNKLVVDGLVEVTYDSANFTNYKLTNLEATKEALQEFENLREKPTQKRKRKYQQTSSTS